MDRFDPASLPSRGRWLVAAAEALGVPGAAEFSGVDALAALVDELARTAPAQPDAVPRLVWLLRTGIVGSLPDAAELLELETVLAVSGPWEAVEAMADRALRRKRAPDRSLEYVGGVLVDVSVTARSDQRAGVARVVSNLAQRWSSTRPVLPVVWHAGAYRRLSDEESDALGIPAAGAADPESRLIPWQATVVVVEVLRPEAHALTVGAAAAVGAVELAAVAYDLAALSVPTSTDDATNGVVLHYLDTLARARRLSAISHAVAADLDDYYRIVSRTGRFAPSVRAQHLPTEPLPPDPSVTASTQAELQRGWGDLPVVLFVSTVQPRKNHLRVLMAAESLWRDGVAFQLVCIEGAHRTMPAVERAFGQLQARGRPVRLMSDVDESFLWAALRLARCTVFASLTEGYGLPAAESLAAGTPVVLTRHGATGEIGADGGALLVDPLRVEEIAAALRTLLLDDAVHSELAAQARARSWPTWDQYADDVWTWLVDGVEPQSAGRDR